MATVSPTTSLAICSRELLESFFATTNLHKAVEGFFNKGGSFVNGYGDRIVSATATQNGPIGKQPIKALDKKPAPSTAPKQANGYTKTALPSASSKVRGLPAPPAGAAKVASTPKTPYVDPFKSAPAAGGKVKVSAASKPKPAGLPAVGSTASNATGALPKPPPPGPGTSNVRKATGALPKPPPPGPGLPKVNGVASQKNDAGKVRISAASRPKPVVK